MHSYVDNILFFCKKWVLQPLMDGTKPHVRGGSRLLYLEYNTFSNKISLMLLSSDLMDNFEKRYAPGYPPKGT
jgi:hypothetical protein